MAGTYPCFTATHTITNGATFSIDFSETSNASITVTPSNGSINGISFPISDTFSISGTHTINNGTISINATVSSPWILTAYLSINGTQVESHQIGSSQVIYFSQNIGINDNVYLLVEEN